MKPDLETCLGLARTVVGKWRWLDGMKPYRQNKGRVGDSISAHLPSGWDDGDDDRIVADDVPDFTDPATAALAQTVAELVHNEPTLHLAPASFDVYDGAPQYWRVERVIDGGTEWLSVSGVWVGMDHRHREQPIYKKTKLEALIAAIMVAP